MSTNELAQHQRPNNRAAHTLRPIQITYDGLSRVDGSGRFAFGPPTGPSALASLSGPIEVRLAAEHPSQATFEVLLRPLAGVPAVEAKALAAVVRGALAPGLILTKNPRTLVQLVVQILVPFQGQELGKGVMREGEAQRDGITVAAINAGTLALLNAGSVPMCGVVCAVAVGRREVDGVVVVDPEDGEEMSARGCFAWLIGGGENRIVWMKWSPGKVEGKGKGKGKGDEEAMEEARVLSRAAASEVWEAMMGSVDTMGKAGVPYIFGDGRGDKDVRGGDPEKDDDHENGDDAKMEI
ncbi:hypothetical protein BDZ94DRAFT_1272658 [Collybia nuda]|uniref:Exoribonuclease phosphorolytic domain-containing protein n=1 Tax=Collybia nuda TaxID=64659 RepID=A0A9P5XW47_9AGAR|nr:hypothetical protein BDZ94DRAFT_1272658 [Collybia nuda]